MLGDGADTKRSVVSMVVILASRNGLSKPLLQLDCAYAILLLVEMP